MSSNFPTKMSCTEAFDRLTECYSIGGLVRHYYRFGEYNKCAKHMDKLMFCIWNSTDPVKVQKWYRDEWEVNKLTRGSSEDVWKVRS
ncbi:HCL646Wp [Eremothecium sinecaudum]|uniref:HCL646Wp n=1 Tax=Eremothecium sinecaudum TaxID=45286 RepID=A0A109UXV4_9SACH|nr:HCL646Wp [Eremothecium sinecaudum]AMD19505.1 HCL646Wp [Eremothecium sinecaudum]